MWAGGPDGLVHVVRYAGRGMRERLVDEGVALVLWALLVGVGGGLAGRWAMRWAAEGVRVGVPADRGLAGPLGVQGPRRGKRR